VPVLFSIATIAVATTSPVCAIAVRSTTGSLDTVGAVVI